MATQARDRADERIQFAARPSSNAPVAILAPPAVPEKRTTHWSTPYSIAEWSWRPVDMLRQAFESEVEHGHAFLFAPVFMVTGVLIYFSLVHEPSEWALMFGLIGLTFVAQALYAWPVLRAASLAALMVLLGMGASKIEASLYQTKMLGAEITTNLTGRIVRVEQQASGRLRLTLDVMATERPLLRYQPDRVRVSARAVPDGLKPGEVVKGTVRLMPPSGPVRPQSYDFSFNSYFEGIGAIGFFLSNPARVDGAQTATQWQKAAATVERWRAAMAGRIATRIGGAEGEIAAALITGIRSGIPEEINEALRITGLYHVISISGLHMALVAGTLMVSLRCAFALAPGFAARRPVKKYAAFSALAATAFYLFISGGDIAAQRSFIMLAVMLLAVMVDRAALTMRNLSISAIIIIMLAPHEVLGPSFQMSFAATAGLVAAYAAWTDLRERRPAQAAARAKRSVLAMSLRSSGKYLGGLSATSLVAGLATALFTAWHFQQVSSLGLVANLAAMPIVSVIVMPMAVLAALLMPIGLDGLPLELMGMGIAAMNAVAIWLAERSVFDSTGAIPLGSVLVLSAALAAITMAGSRLRLFASPLLLAGAVMIWNRELPDVLISEDAQLVALRLSDGRVAVNKDRPRAFIMQNWQRALDGDAVERPEKRDMAVWPAQEGRFRCDDTLCVARHAGGGVIVHASSREAAASACARASVIVIDDATAVEVCKPDQPVLVITRRDVAERGSVALQFRAVKGLVEARAQFAIGQPYRAWHDHRRFSREARGLPPYQRRNPD